MKTRLTIFVVVLSLALAAVSLAANPKPVYKVGDEVYVCNCGEACCDEISKHPGKCVCGPDMAKAKVVSVGKGKVVLQAEGWEKPRTFKTVAKYACACGPKCDCDTISQKPGKCPCGTEMKAIK